MKHIWVIISNVVEECQNCPYKGKYQVLTNKSMQNAHKNIIENSNQEKIPLRYFTTTAECAGKFQDSLRLESLEKL